MSQAIFEPINIHKKGNIISGSKPSEIARSQKLQRPFESLSEFEQKHLLKQMKVDYSLIVFDYFASQDSIKAKIADFAYEAFAVNLPISKVIEIHISLINDLEHQLMLEGLHSDEYITDFRLTLIDTIARLGELYRQRAKIL